MYLDFTEVFEHYVLSALGITSLSACKDIHEGSLASPCDPHEASQDFGPECTADSQQQLQPWLTTLHVDMRSVLGTLLCKHKQAK